MVHWVQAVAKKDGATIASSVIMVMQEILKTIQSGLVRKRRDEERAGVILLLGKRHVDFFNLGVHRLSPFSSDEADLATARNEAYRLLYKNLVQIE